LACRVLSFSAHLSGPLGVGQSFALPNVTFMLNLGFLGVEYLLLGNCANVSIARRIIVLLDHGHEAASGFCAAEVKHALVHVVHVLLLRA